MMLSDDSMAGAWQAAGAWRMAAGDEVAVEPMKIFMEVPEEIKPLAALPARIHYGHIEVGVWEEGDDTFGQKSIGLVGGIMLLANNLAGPTITLLPGLAQEAGWLSVPLALLTVSVVSCFCVYMLVYAMRAIPQNSDFGLRVEYVDVMHYYMPHVWYVIMIVIYYVNLILTLMSLIIQTSQVADYVLLDMFGCAYGLELWPNFGVVCGDIQGSITPFGDIVVVSAAMGIVAVISIPFALKNLDDNVLLQYAATVGLLIISVVWVVFFYYQVDFPTHIPVVTTSQYNLISTLLFNFAFISTLPSWVNEMESGVSVGVSVGVTMVFVVVIYTVIGVMGGMAFPPYYQTDEDLFSKLNASGSRIGQATVVLYPILQNVTSIPVYSIMMRYNLLQSGSFSTFSATLVSVILPWVMSVPFYTGKGFQNISDFGGLLCSSLINFLVPPIVYVLARRAVNGGGEDYAPMKA